MFASPSLTADAITPIKISKTLSIGQRQAYLLHWGSRAIPAHDVSAIRPRSLVGADCAGSMAVNSDQPLAGTGQITRNNNMMCMSYTATG